MAIVSGSSGASLRFTFGAELTLPCSSFTAPLESTFLLRKLLMILTPRHQSLDVPHDTLYAPALRLRRWQLTDRTATHHMRRAGWTTTTTITLALYLTSTGVPYPDLCPRRPLVEERRVSPRPSTSGDLLLIPLLLPLDTIKEAILTLSRLVNIEKRLMEPAFE
jgi:hypothetical protein